jgi:hypothetical protein
MGASKTLIGFHPFSRSGELWNVVEGAGDGKQEDAVLVQEFAWTVAPEKLQKDRGRGLAMWIGTRRRSSAGA